MFKCTRCSSVYKHKKTLNKHWKDKHSDADSKETDESVGGSLTNAESLDASPCSGTSSHRRGMRNSLRRAPCDDLPTMVKRRRTAIPIAPVASTSNWTPLDLAVTQGTNSEAALAEEARENAEVKGTEEGNGKEPRQTQETTPPSSQRVLLTGLLQTTLDVLNAEPASVMNIDDISPSASAMLHVLGSILCFSTNRVAKPVVASSWIGRTQGLQIPYPLSNGGGRPMNGLNGHMVNHRNLRDQMEHLPDDAVVHFATYHPPPLIDSLNQAVSTSATALSQVNPSLLALSIPVVAQAPQPPVGGLSDSHEMEAKSSESDNTADGIADTASNSQTSALTDAPLVLAPVSLPESLYGVSCSVWKSPFPLDSTYFACNPQ